MNKAFNILLFIVGLLCAGLAVYYWMTPANMLPSFLPGYDPSLTSVHFKHGLAALIVGAALLVSAWFRTGKKKSVASQGATS